VSGVCAAIAAYNSEATVADVVRGVRRHLGVVLVADDGSNDRTAAEARGAGADVLVLPENRGKGNALRLLFDEARRRGFDAVVVLDADGQHDPDDLPGLLDAHARQPDALIAGSRMREADAIPGYRYNSMLVARFYICLAANRFVEDTQCGYRLYPLKALEGMAVRKERYVTETEILVKAGDSGVPIVGVPVRAIYSGAHGSHFRRVPDVAAISVYVISYMMVKWAIEGVRPGTVFTYGGAGTGRDRFGKTPGADWWFEVLTLFSALPLTAFYFGWYFLSRLVGGKSFAGLRSCGVPAAKVLGSTMMLPALLLVSTVDLACGRLGFRPDLSTGFVRRFYPNLWK
jgi:glycosyltransferase involved in cell wall biosynthesis